MPTEKLLPSLWITSAVMRSSTISTDSSTSAMISVSSAFILEWNSRQATPSPMSQRLAEPLRASGLPVRLMSERSSTPSGRVSAV